MSLSLTWPPSLATYKDDLKLAADDTRFDTPLQITLDAAVAYVERVRTDVTYAATDDAPATVTPDLVLGTLRLARRWDARRDSVLAVVLGGDLGSQAVPAFDSDVDRLLRIGRYARTRFA